ncbi:acyl-CoA thioesterase [Bacillus shivajii]|uniref:acyl-CoA thioesterase n=1 Tax=Bacillus shivajii TaxID=1983719 RepID=UPI001CF9595F|nr:thioesterase family protein [Bacillus shivajii]UCZ52179.1 acyl-CoA thioesterase [Bacillus shivajii]
MALPSYIEDFETWQEDFRYRYQISVRFSETDAFGHLNNTNAFVYFEHGRINFFKDTGLVQEWFSKDGETIPVTADLHCDYLKQVYFDEKLDICVKVAHIGNSSVDLHYLIVNEKGEPCMTGRGKIVQVSRETGKPSPWTDSAKGYLQKGF